MKHIDHEENLVYDTEKAEEVSVSREGKKLMRTPKGRYFLYKYDPTKEIQPVSKEKAKKFVSKYPHTSPQKFEEIFDVELEEA